MHVKVSIGHVRVTVACDYFNFGTSRIVICAQLFFVKLHTHNHCEGTYTE